MKFTLEIDLGEGIKTYRDVYSSVLDCGATISDCDEPLTEGMKANLWDNHGDTVGKWEVTDTPADPIELMYVQAFEGETENERAKRLAAEPAEKWGGYANDIIKNPDDYDGLEIHGVRDLFDGDDKNGTCCEPVTGTDLQPQFFSVYAHLKEGGVECIGDFETADAARSYALIVSLQHSSTTAPANPEPWPIADHTDNKPEPTGEDMTLCRDCGTQNPERNLLEPHLEKLENGAPLPVGSCPHCLGPCYPVGKDRAGYVPAPRPYALVTVSGGVAEMAICDGDIAYDILDYDNLKESIGHREQIILSARELAYIRANDDADFIAQVEEALKPAGERQKRYQAEELFETLKDSQTAMWDAAKELETLLGVEIDTTDDFSDTTLESLTAEDEDEEDDDGDTEECNGWDCQTRVTQDDPYYATPCGTFCSACMVQHVKDCGICRNEFGSLA
jgi:hypothetical protein